MQRALGILLIGQRGCSTPPCHARLAGHGALCQTCAQQAVPAAAAAAVRLVWHT
jgi:hypothetical protein